MSNNIGPLLTMWSTILSNKSQGVYQEFKKKEDENDPIIAIVLVVFFSILLVLGIILTGEKKEDDSTVQTKGVGYFATNLHGKYNSIIFIGDTSVITKDSATLFMKNNINGGYWFLEIKEYYNNVEYQRLEQVKKNEILKIEKEKNKNSMFDCMERKFMDYKCEKRDM